MHALADDVTAWLDAGLPVTLARVVDTAGFSASDRAPVAAFTPGRAPVGRLVTDELTARVAAAGAAGSPGLVELVVDDAEAAAAGLSCGGRATVLVEPATALPAGLWAALRAGEPVGLVTPLPPGGAPGPTTLLTADEPDQRLRRLLARGATQTVRLDDRAVTTAWPVPTLLVVGDGLLAAALKAQAALLGWAAGVADGPDAAGAVAGLGRADALVVLSHRREVDGPVLAAALRGPGGPGYVGALGSRRTQDARRQWLRDEGLTDADVDRVHGPAGLDVGAYSPAEIAVSITAEVLAVRAGADGTALRDRPGPVHPGGVHAPPPRHPLA